MGLDDNDDLSQLIRRHASRHAAPESLRAGIRTQIALAEAARDEAPERHRWWAVLGRTNRWLSSGWRLAGSSFALGAACMTLLLPTLQRIQIGQPAEQRAATELVAELVADHVHALQVGPLTEVVSTDRHTVKPWFQGRLDFAPPVFDLAADGFPLLGGRVERVQGQAVAALAYRHNRHLIDVYVWPATAPLPLQARQHKGFNVLRWADGAMQISAVSDLDRAELSRFAARWQVLAAAP